MRLIIAGSRDLNGKHHAWMYKCLQDCWFTQQNDEFIEVVSGGARGADAFGAQWAYEHVLRCKVFPANWDKYGKSAGYIRNEEMAEYADALVAFWDGTSKGTKHMIDLAIKHGLYVKVFRVDEA